MPSQFHRSIGRQRLDTPADVAERINARKAGELAVKQREQRYPTLTPDNAQEAMEFQEAAYRTALAELNKQSGDPL